MASCAGNFEQNPCTARHKTQAACKDEAGCCPDTYRSALWGPEESSCEGAELLLCFGTCCPQIVTLHMVLFRESFQALGGPLCTTALSDSGPVVATTDRQPLQVTCSRPLT